MSTQPHAVRRIDPRRAAQLTPQGLRRSVLGAGAGDPVAAQPAQPHAPAASAKPLRSNGPFHDTLLVVAHTERGAFSDAARQAIAAAAILANAQTQVVVAALGACHDDVATLGVDRLLVPEAFDARRYQPTACVQWLQGLRSAWAPAHWLFADHGADGELGRRFAVQSGLDLACGVLELGAESLRVPADSRDDWLRPHAPVMLLGPGLVNPRLPFVGQGLRETAPPLPQRPEPGVEDLGVQAGDPRTLALEEADLILAAGNGVHDLALFHALAHEVGAAVGASRVAVDAGRFARAQQIGATGKSVSASAYVALGISGAVQHLQGIRDCRHVIAVTLDASAPIASRANLTVVEDSTALMQALIALVRQQKESA
ncbi:FAD-binding protein [Verminephrobacter aporrectodeae]|uniref:FAD-binding protein n=1 Tax=Verminephrobacter aporrectodeae TaxID=1110389 RepID=UPI0022438D42|nr:FAD-binding protein [Verminephrobacter aporrectodeae]MCW8174461.1 electron transfer flavoprotein subunit alpha/FixB family protein [Verminephrobacter aporrectodeae subsp. tuberculatae]MCW8201800.1 electron transfer flavoprotein subunit alpha/FixB family protein [Verminephrobacter aporrectodeae subsp. tuberculatae]